MRSLSPCTVRHLHAYFQSAGLCRGDHDRACWQNIILAAFAPGGDAPDQHGPGHFSHAGQAVQCPAAAGLPVMTMITPRRSLIMSRGDGRVGQIFPYFVYELLLRYAILSFWLALTSLAPAAEYADAYGPFDEPQSTRLSVSLQALQIEDFRALSSGGNCPCMRSESTRTRPPKFG